jgi:8-oxo-dGTP pyrophosphatase MutT (NUDIX family)
MIRADEDYFVNIVHIIDNIKPWDALESAHIQDTLTWIHSGAPIFRIEKPDIPNKHLVSYFVVIDPNTLQVLLVDHKKAALWLPAGGHVEINEDPKETVRRECLEELGVEANFWFSDPIFLTSKVTVGHAGDHTDVSVWYVLKGDCQHEYAFDHTEFHQIQWFSFNEIPYQKSDPHMQRFIDKLSSML